MYLSGEIARREKHPVIDLISIGKIDRPYLLELIEKAENAVKRKIRCVTYATPEYPVSGRAKKSDPRRSGYVQNYNRH